MKRVTDPEQILLLWQAGLMVHDNGIPWGVRPPRCDEWARDEISGMLRNYPEHCNINVEEEDDKGE